MKQTATIYAPPDSLKLPKLDFKQMNRYQSECDKYINDLKGILIKRKKGDKQVGEVIKFQVADGYALYMIASMKPLELVHIPIGDAYEFGYVDLLTHKEVNELIKKEKMLNRLFGGKKNN